MTSNRKRQNLVLTESTVQAGRQRDYDEESEEPDGISLGSKDSDASSSSSSDDEQDSVIDMTEAETPPEDWVSKNLAKSQRFWDLCQAHRHANDETLDINDVNDRDNVITARPRTGKGKDGKPTHNYMFTFFRKTAGDDPTSFSALVAAMIRQDLVSFLAYGIEVAKTTKNPHIHMVIALKKKSRRSAIRDFFQELEHPLPWFEACRGQLWFPYNYCIKEDKDPFIYGTPPTKVNKGGQATKEKYDRAYKLCVENKIDQIDSDIQIRHYGNLQNILRNVGVTPPPALPPWTKTLIWCYGVTGSGKSRFPRQLARMPGCEPTKDRESDGVYVIDPDTNFWDNYLGEMVMLRDEFSPQEFKTKVSQCKTETDVYPIRRQVKHGNVVLRPRYFVYTTNYHVREFFDGHRSEVTYDPIRRRTLAILYFGHEYDPENPVLPQICSPNNLNALPAVGEPQGPSRYDIFDGAFGPGWELKLFGIERPAEGYSTPQQVPQLNLEAPGTTQEMQ